MTDPIKDKTDVLFRLFEEGKQFTSELLRENERLRLFIAAQKAEGQAMKRIGEEGGGSDPQTDQLRYKRELDELKKNISELEKENREFAERFIRVEQQNQSMASLYVSSYRLHSTLDFKEVINTIKEIIINLIGSEVFGIFLKDPDRNELGLVAHEGLENMYPRFDSGSESRVERLNRVKVTCRRKRRQAMRTILLLAFLSRCRVN